MKKLLLILATLYLVTIVSNAQDFRKSKWGMSIQEVKTTETTEALRESDKSLIFATELAGYETFAIYIFADNKLTRAKYSLREKHTNKNDYIFDYKRIKSLLSQKYNSPKEDETIWKNDLYKDDYSDWGMAISVGHLLYYSSWELERTTILAMLSGENYDISTVIEYSSIELASLEDQENEKKELENFNTTGFRKCIWGGSPEFVKENEDEELNDETTNLLAYKTRVSGLDMLAGYKFTNNKLTGGIYIVDEEHTNKNDYISDYKSLKKTLTTVYGNPIIDNENWKNDLYKDDYSDWGMAVSVGHLVYISTFKNEDTEVTLFLHGENYNISLSVSAESVKLKELVEAKNKKEDLKGF